MEQVIFERSGGSLVLADGRASAELAMAGDVPLLLARLGVMKPLIVSGGGLARSGIAEEMEHRGMPVVHFDGFTPNPTAEQVAAGLAMYRDNACDGILSIGGGSALDVAKAIKAMGDTDDNTSLLERLTHPVPMAVPHVAVNQRILRRFTSAARNIRWLMKRCCRKWQFLIRRSWQRCRRQSGRAPSWMRFATASNLTGRCGPAKKVVLTRRRPSAF